MYCIAGNNGGVLNLVDWQYLENLPNFGPANISRYAVCAYVHMYVCVCVRVFTLVSSLFSLCF